MIGTKIRVYGVKWDIGVFDEIPEIPADVTLTIRKNIDLEDTCEIDNFIEDMLSDDYGFVHKGWESSEILKEGEEE